MHTVRKVKYSTYVIVGIHVMEKVDISLVVWGVMRMLWTKAREHFPDVKCCMMTRKDFVFWKQ